MISCTYLFWLTMLASLCGSSISFLSDFKILDIPVIYSQNYINISKAFSLNYSELLSWKEVTRKFAEQIETDVPRFTDQIKEQLDPQMYELRDENQRESSDSIYADEAVSGLFNQMFSRLSQKSVSFANLYLTNPLKQFSQPTSTNNSFDINPVENNKYETVASLINVKKVSQLPSFLRQKARFILYQSLGANTGGTTAMNILYDTMVELGFNVFLCNDDNRYAETCRRPSDDHLIITGEWCHGVLQEYTDVPVPDVSCESTDIADGICKATESFEFRGRGLQYYLGFHHNDDACRGRVAVGNGHFMNQQIGRRLLGAYYLGCPMTNTIKDIYLSMLDYIQDKEFGSGMHTSSGERVDKNENVIVDIRVRKENLIIIDPDFSRDYPPENIMGFELPLGYKMLYAQKIPSARMPYILQRAKIVLDLGMPGAERISGEALMMGAIPIVSNRWNGASEMDFPGIFKVDHTNGTEISELLEYVAAHYEQLVGIECKGSDRSKVIATEKISNDVTKNSLNVIYSHGYDNSHSQLSTHLFTSDFLLYTLSMWDKLYSTSDIVFSSAHLHFVLYATNDNRDNSGFKNCDECCDNGNNCGNRNSNDCQCKTSANNSKQNKHIHRPPPSLYNEYILNYQVLTLLYLYPLCSIDIYVYDVVWYMRHHYTFHDILKSSGYIRIDPLNPTEFKYWKQSSGGIAYVNIKSIVKLRSDLHSEHSKLIRLAVADTNNQADVNHNNKIPSNNNDVTTIANNSVLSLIPVWSPMLIILHNNHLVFRNPHTLLRWISDMHHDSVKHIYTSRISADNNSSSIGYSNGNSCGNSALNSCTNSGDNKVPRSTTEVATLISPDAVITTDLLADIIASANDDTASNNKESNHNKHTEDKHHEIFLTTQAEHEIFVNMCSLINSRDSESESRETKDDLVFGVVHSIPWLTLHSYNVALNFEC